MEGHPLVLSGGLMRCCDKTIIDDHAARTEPAKEGEQMACKYCQSPIVFRGGAWEWADGADDVL